MKARTPGRARPQLHSLAVAQEAPGPLAPARRQAEEDASVLRQVTDVAHHPPGEVRGRRDGDDLLLAESPRDQARVRERPDA